MPLIDVPMMLKPGCIRGKIIDSISFFQKILRHSGRSAFNRASHSISNGRSHEHSINAVAKIGLYSGIRQGGFGQCFSGLMPVFLL